MKIKIPLILIVGIIIISASGCTDTIKGNDAESLIPEQCNLIGNIALSSILEDKDFNALYDNAPKSSNDPETFQDVLDELNNESGIDVKEISDVTFFGEINETNNKYGGIFLSGSFDSKKLLESIIEEGELEEGEYQGYKYYYETSYGGEVSNAVMEIDDSMILLSFSNSVIKDVIHIKEGDEKPISGELLKKYQSLDRGLFSLAFEVPEFAKDEVVESEGTYSFESFSEIEMFTYVLQKKGSTIKNIINLYASDSTSAVDIADVIDGFIKVGKGSVTDQTMKDSLSKIEINQEGSTVKIESSITIEEIEEITDEYSQGSYL